MKKAGEVINKMMEYQGNKDTKGCYKYLHSLDSAELSNLKQFGCELDALCRKIEKEKQASL